MTSTSVYICSLIIILTILLCDSNGDGTESSSPTGSTAISSTTTLTTLLSTNETAKNGTEEKGGILDFGKNKGMLMRAFYVLIGITAIVVVYFGLRAWRLRRKRNKSKKYGLITGRGADYEMAPLDADDDDDDEDTTVFEMNRRKK